MWFDIFNLHNVGAINYSINNILCTFFRANSILLVLVFFFAFFMFTPGGSGPAPLDGGLAQLFTLELTYLSRSTDDILVRNVTLSKPRFDIKHLESGVRYEARVYASNRKGRSTPINLRVSTLKRPSEGKRLATISSGSGKPNKKMVKIWQGSVKNLLKA